MLKELFDAISEQAKKAAGPCIIKGKPEPDHVYGIMGPGGEIDWIETDPQPRNHIAASLEPIIVFASDNEGAAIWYHRSAVVCLVDDLTRRDRVTLPLQFSVELQQLQAWEAKRPALSQRDLIFTLRTTFAKCMGRAGNLISVLRGVRFKSASDGTSTVEHGKRSVGRQIEQSITGLDALPEYVVFDVPIFDAASLQAVRYWVECALEPDPATETFQVIPLPGEIERAIGNAEGNLYAILSGAVERPIYYGTP